ncbi:MAG: acyl-ACP desaturase [Ilumatobacter sp.]|uniref:acyl-ACP desaturase n=1 Tax=Ilumatobacter sp. TaxID=1967498 RepID=UPI00391DA323
MNDEQLIAELTPVIETLLERHIAASKEWFPHEHIPHSRGRDIEPGHVWSESDAELDGHALSPSVRSALYVNLLTEDNLPYYFRTVEAMFGKEGPWGEWVRRWTAEEGRHSMVLYGYLAATQAVDLVHLERGRMAQVSRGETPAPASIQEGFVYLALQELATRISHRNTGLQMGDPVGYDVMKRVASDENLHQLFYRDLATAAVEADPNSMMIAMEKQVRSFAMPGTGIPDFDHHAALIAQAGIYDLQIHHEQILAPVVLRQWDAGNIGGLTGEGAEAQERLMKRMAQSERVAQRYASKRAAAQAKAAELQTV